LTKFELVNLIWSTVLFIAQMSKVQPYVNFDISAVLFSNSNEGWIGKANGHHHE
jgi:hypothetical protein